jgi:hypothetical protein
MYENHERLLLLNFPERRYKNVLSAMEAILASTNLMEFFKSDADALPEGQKHSIAFRRLEHGRYARFHNIFKMSVPVLCIPHLNRHDLLHRCIASIDYPVDMLLLVQNGRDEETQIEQVLSLLQSVPVGHFTHIRGPNLGCAASWNYAMIAFPASPWWMFVGNDVQFTPGAMQTMAETAEANHLDVAAIFANVGHSCFIQTRRGTEKVGLFDFNIHPAYTEDSDWMWRMIQSGERHLDTAARVVHGAPGMPGSSTIYSDVKLRDQNERSHSNNFAYYIRKHGGMPGQEVYKSPFNMGGSVADLRYEPETRARNIWTI